MKRRPSAIESMREMIIVCNGVDSPYRIPERSTGSTPSQELIDCALEVARICFDAKNQLSWSRRRESLNEQLQWSTEETVLNNLARIIDEFAHTSHMQPADIALMDEASCAIDLVLAKFDGDIH